MCVSHKDLQRSIDEMGTRQTGGKPRRIAGGGSTTLDDRNLRGSVNGIMDVGSDSKISQDNNIYTGNLLAIFLFLFVCFCYIS